MNMRAYYLTRFFFINFNFNFKVLAQKCLQPCVNCVLKFQIFFLNLSSKVLAGVGVRTSNFPYMDICEDLRVQLMCLVWLIKSWQTTFLTSFGLFQLGVWKSHGLPHALMFKCSCFKPAV